MTRISALWRLDEFLDREAGLTSSQRLALLSWILELQDDQLPRPAVEVTNDGRTIRIALLEEAGVAVTYRIMATGRPRLLRIERREG